ncbi:hypothetical protein [Actinocrispum wychmicini]|uniref:Uncharacterized protein n=1 Tax=Actinocrispum wychmicini TaxID=1213861 RepID=A0A4R2JLV0_9PSEU|nr:hypothetical protein [Actinocrispum wychmicini]TCO58048.1 hypothetical protein EV192_105111 [Actinocrispum wychmicini]
MGHTHFRRSLYVGVDIRGYGAAPEQRQEKWQETLLRCLDRAAASMRLNRQTWARQQHGDAELCVLPAEEPEPLVVDGFTRRLESELRVYNEEVMPWARLRLRMAVHHGVVVDGPNGYPCRDAVVVSRLLNSKPLRGVLEQWPQANLAVMLSELVYHSVVEAGHTSLRTDQFRRLAVREKEFKGYGWLWLPGRSDSIDMFSRPVVPRWDSAEVHARPYVVRADEVSEVAIRGRHRAAVQRGFIGG